jgi:multiple sugar transport system permease protein
MIMSHFTRTADGPRLLKLFSPGKKSRFNWGIVLILPYLVMMFLFNLAPVVTAIIFSFSKFVGGRPQIFAAGLQNYIKVFADPAFSRSYSNVLQFSVLATIMGFVGSVGVALLLSLTHDRIGSVTRSVLFLPGSINAAVVGLIFIFMLDPLVSPFGFILRSFGWNSTTDYVSSSNAVLVMTVIRFFMSSGAWIAIFYSALESVPLELVESARMDGCGPWQLAWNIRRPIIMGFVWFMIIQLISYNLQIFAEPYIISRALGVGSFIDPYWSPNMLGAYYTLTLGDMGMSAVVSLSQTLISLSASIFIVTKTGAFTTDVA